MRSIDFSPLYRSAIGFDRLANLSSNLRPAMAMPVIPYNIEQLGDSDYRISMAVAGFYPGRAGAELQENLLTVKGNKQADTGRNYLYQGLPNAVSSVASSWPTMCG